jgi:hypothetical protein
VTIEELRQANAIGDGVEKTICELSPFFWYVVYKGTRRKFKSSSIIEGDEQIHS